MTTEVPTPPPAPGPPPTSTAAAPASPGERGPRRRHLVAVAVVAAVLATVVSVPAAVWASNTFSDVPDSNPFHDDIGWMAETGISTGYEDGTYLPANPVSRQAMSAFMRRLYDLRDPIDTWRSQFGFNFTSEEWTTPFADPSATVTVPDGTEAVLTVTFNADGRCVTSVCYGAVALDGVQLKNAQHCRDCYFEPFTLIASTDPVGPGTYTFTFQGLRTSSYGASPDWSLRNVDLIAEAHLLPSGGEVAP
jgi:hypothetical protein